MSFMQRVFRSRVSVPRMLDDPAATLLGVVSRDDLVDVFQSSEPLNAACNESVANFVEAHIDQLVQIATSEEAANDVGADGVEAGVHEGGAAAAGHVPQLD